MTSRLIISQQDNKDLSIDLAPMIRDLQFKADSMGITGTRSYMRREVENNTWKYRLTVKEVSGAQKDSTIKIDQLNMDILAGKKK